MISRKLLTKMIVAFGVGGVFGWLTWSLLPENKQRSLEVLGSHAHSLLAVSNCLFVSALILSISFAYSRPDKTESTFDKRIAQFFFESESDDNRLKLNPHIGVFLFVAVSALYIPVFLLWAFGFLSVSLSTSIEIWMKILLPIVGGIGGVFYLVLKYREQQNDERKLIFDEKESERQQKNFESEIATKKQELIAAETKYADERKRLDESAKQEELNNAIRLLGDSSTQVRLAGVYALTDVADRYVDGYKQRVVDILCGYLRTDRSDQLVGGKFKDAAVESAIIKVIGEHLRKDREGLNKVQTLTDEQLWCDCSFDFRGATFTEPVLWEKTLWNKTVDFSNAIFTKNAVFMRSVFTGHVDFGGTHFELDTVFVETRFNSSSWFAATDFGGKAFFGTSCFIGDTYFAESFFKNTVFFTEASFIGSAIFDKVIFNNISSFDGVIIGTEAAFPGVRFDSFSGFEGASFLREIGLETIVFKQAPRVEEFLVSDPDSLANFGKSWNKQEYSDEWTLEKKTERLKKVYKQFCKALNDHSQKEKKLADIQKTINKNFPGVTLDFKALETEAEKEL